MKKNMFLPSIFIVLLILVGYLLVKPKKLIIGFCPTMANYLADLQNDRSVSLVAYDSSHEALNGVVNDKVDCVVIGRKAQNQEVEANILVKQFDEEATTLVRKINTDHNESFLMPWKEVDYSQVGLVVLTDENGLKLAEHRTPFLYYSKQISNKRIEQIVSFIGEKI